MGKIKHGMYGTRIYKIFYAMISRCENPNNLAYKNYGGRGIKVCERWHKFENFYADVGDPPEGYNRQRWFYGHGPSGEMVIENNQCHVARVFGLCFQNISKCLHGERPRCKGWIFQWLT